MPFLDVVSNGFSGPRLALGGRFLPWRLFPGRAGAEHGRHEFATTDGFGSLSLFGGSARLELGGTITLRSQTIEEDWEFPGLTPRAYMGGVLLDKLSVGVRLHPLRSDRPSEAFLGFTWLL